MFHNQINEKIAIVINDFEIEAIQLWINFIEIKFTVDVHGMRKPFLSYKIATVQGKNVTALNETRFILLINILHNQMH